jgi:hypothetical protein
MVPEIRMTAERMAALAADKPVTKRECRVTLRERRVNAV